MTWECGKGVELRLAKDTAHNPKFTARSSLRAHPGEGRNQAATVTPFSQREQRDSVSIPTGEGKMSCSSAQEPAQE